MAMAAMAAVMKRCTMAQKMCLGAAMQKTKRRCRNATSRAFERRALGRVMLGGMQVCNKRRTSAAKKKKRQLKNEKRVISERVSDDDEVENESLERKIR